MIVAAAVQMRFAWSSDVPEFTAWTAAHVETARARGANLVVLPAYIGLSLMGIGLRGWREMRTADVLRITGYPDLSAYMGARGQNLAQAYVEACSSVARRSHVNLVAGSAIVPYEDSKLYNVAFLFSASGSLIGAQRQTHLNARERAWGLSRRERLDVFECDQGRLGLVVASDIRYPEVSRILTLQGANILVNPDAGSDGSQAGWMAGLWREVQANQVFGLQACLVGNVWGEDLQGHASVHLPLNVTLDRRGVLSAVDAEAGEGVAVAELDFDRLQQAVDNYPMSRVFNPRVPERYFPSAYGSQPKMGDL